MEKRITPGLLVKQKIVADIKKQIQAARSVVFFHYHGIDANTMNNLRATSLQENVLLKIYKNNLIRITLSDLGLLKNRGLNNKEKIIHGPVACLFSHSENPFAAFVVAKQARLHLQQKFAVVYSIFEQAVIPLETAADFLNYKHKTDIYQKLLWTLQYPITKLISLMSAVAITNPK